MSRELELFLGAKLRLGCGWCNCWKPSGACVFVGGFVPSTFTYSYFDSSFSKTIPFYGKIEAELREIYPRALILHVRTGTRAKIFEPRTLGEHLPRTMSADTQRLFVGPPDAFLLLL